MVSQLHRPVAPVHDPYAPASARNNARKRAGAPSAIERLMQDSANGLDVTSQLKYLKEDVLADGIEADESGMSAHRVYIWLVLLQCPITPYSTYAALLARGASPSYAKINNDTFRTLATDPLFARRVSQNSISRLLNTIAWTLHDAAVERSQAEHSLALTTELPPSPPPELASETSEPPSSILAEPPSPRVTPLGSRSPAVTPARNQTATTTTSKSLPAVPIPATHVPPATYLQGMNVLAAPLLYASRSEPQAYTLLQTLLQIHIPSYITPSMTGVHRALGLVSRLLAFLDPQLSNYLASKKVYPETWAFASILTLSACTPPLPEVLVLWDFYFAWGVHLNVLGVVAQVYLIRERLLNSDSPGRELRGMPSLEARKVIKLVVSFVGKVKEDLWGEVVRHTALEGVR